MFISSIIKRRSAQITNNIIEYVCTAVKYIFNKGMWKSARAAGIMEIETNYSEDKRHEIYH